MTREHTGLSELEELYLRHVPRARALAYLLTGNHHAAEDLVQDAFVKVAGRFKHLRDPHSFEAYLRRTVVNLHTSRLRRVRIERTHEAQQHPNEQLVVSSEDAPERMDLWQAVCTLPTRQRSAVVLRYYEDLSEQEAAEALGCSRGALKALVTRALRTLRESVGGKAHEG